MNDFEMILDRIEANRAILFLGAGSTVQCRRGDGQTGLTGWELSREILRELVGKGKTLPLQDREIPPLMESAEYFQCNHPGQRQALDDFLQSRLKGLQPTLAHYLAASFPWKAVVTTNYNTVAEDAWREASNHGYAAQEMITIKTDDDIRTKAGERSKVRLFKPHGCVDLQMSPHNRMVITSHDYAESEKIRKSMYAEIRDLAKNCTTVFVGFSLADYTFRNLYYRLYMELGEWTHKCFSVAPVANKQLLSWKSKAMLELNTTLLDTTFSAFMLHLVKTRGTLHNELKAVVQREWKRVRTKDAAYLGTLRPGDFTGLPSPKLHRSASAR